MIELLLPFTPGLGCATAATTAACVEHKVPWLRPRLVACSAPPGPERALEALTLAGAAPVLLWNGATALDPTWLDPAGLAPLPAAVAIGPGTREDLWRTCESILHLPAQPNANGFVLDLIWAPDGAALAALWRDTEIQLKPNLPADLWPHQRLMLAFPPALRRLAPERHLNERQKLPPAWRQRKPPIDGVGPVIGEETPLHELLWSSSDLGADLTRLAEIGLSSDPLPGAPPPYAAIKAATLLRQPSLLALAWEQLLAAPADPQHWGLALDLWLAAGRCWPFTPPLQTPEQLPVQHRVLLLQALQAGWMTPPFPLDALMASVPVAHQALQQRPVAIDTVLDALPSVTPEDRASLRSAYQAAPPSIRHSAFRWASVDAVDPAALTRLELGILQALSDGSGFSLLRLGDGEALFLAGERPCLGGATSNGRQVDPRLHAGAHLPPDLHDLLANRFLQAIEAADAVGVPDLSQCLQGPKHYSLVMTILWRLLPAERQAALAPRLLPGGCHLHLYWLASGAYERPPFLNVHGVIAPQLPPNLAGRVNWQPIPGEKGHHGDAPGPAHYPVVYNETLAWIDHQAGPGRLFLVGAGILGKIYCDAIRERGGVAIDVGSVMDLCGGLSTSRGEFRLNPFLQPLAARAFRQPPATA